MDPRPCLRSGDSALDLICGKPEALPPAIFYTLFRAGLIGVGLYAAGVRENLVRNALAGAAAIEVSVLIWALAHRSHCPLPTAGNTPPPAG